MNYEAVIGIETHVELKTRSKMFCGCSAEFGAEPNTHTCPVCLGLPGALPVPNEQAIEWIVAIGLALDSTIAPWSVFHRKNYFYADMPKNYQISQFDIPICSDGHLDVVAEGEAARIGVTRVHMEEDTGKSTHVGGDGRIQSADYTLLDFNRAGVPLVEIVSEPDLRSPAQARAYVQELREIVATLDVSDVRLEEGSMRFDANISLRPQGSEVLGVKVEIKNMNSFRSLERALTFEVERQRRLLDAGTPVSQETRHWDEAAGVTHSMRSKEESSDYRYFTEPDLVPIVVSDEWRERIRAGLPELPARQRVRYITLGLDPGTAATLVAGGLGDFFEAAVDAGGKARTVANWLTGEVTAYLRREGKKPSDTSLTGEALAELSGLVDGGDLSSSAAKPVLEGVLSGEGSPREVAERRDLLQLSDVGVLEAVVDEVLGANPEAADRLRSGDMKVLAFLMGQVMRATRGKADPKRANEMLRSRA
ncbi:aspartyl/glutamyl-tRNA(Asn/Gln) amidotransferase subunit B [bacterium BMS3Abin02]|nr:aspartyl/glutamyl-tRNA(Asn/Gln) amidotransferase subunit B [bacterium BMS3Abin02]GBE22769.1 aspartyl/glutamyl-tRNA(Asn/Gln) amidotransferase subunit B [bacterium BMS3Bbin01]HDK44881.1 Asp-tRNA(Asn)/Glu-tRNA(Gln) amidotransferase subunit GatB [Actinomycetota bacterium]